MLVDAVMADADEAALRLRRLAAEVRAVALRLEREATTCVWHSSAAEAFRDQVRQRRVQADEVGALLEEAAARLATSADTARAAAAAAARLVQRLPWP